MPQEKLFSIDTEQTGLTKTNSIRNTLHNEYGLSVLCDDITVKEMTDLHYRKITGKELSCISQLFQYVPQIAANSITQNAVETSFKVATEGTYRIRLGAGMHLCRSHLTPGAYRAVGLSNETNQIAGNAELLANDVKLNVGNTPQFALGVFNVVSMVTGQYFMSQVNSKLSYLEARVKKLENMLDAQRHGELKAVAQELEDIREKVEFIILDVFKTNEAIAQIHDIQRIASKSMNTTQELIKNERKSFRANDKVDTIKAHLESIVKYLVDYQYATQIYGIATLFEVHLRNITDLSELSVFRDQINKRVDRYKADQDRTEHAITTYLNKTHALNELTPFQSCASILAGIASAFPLGRYGAVFGPKVSSLSNDLFSEYNRITKAEISNQCRAAFALLKDTTLLDAPASSIDLFIDTVDHEIEYVKIGDAYFTNLPKA